MLYVKMHFCEGYTSKRTFASITFLCANSNTPKCWNLLFTRFSRDVKMPISRCSQGSIQPELQHVQNANGIMMPILPTNLL